MSKRLKRGIAIVLVCLMTAMVFSGCTNKTTPEATPSATTESQSVEPEKSEVAEVTETASVEPEEELEQVTLKMYMVGGGEDDNDIVWGEINKLLTAKIKAEIEPVVISFSDREQKVPLILASGETYDIMFLAAWNFMSTIADGAYVALDDMLPKYGPNLLANIPDVGWKTGTFNGKKYMVPKNESEYQTNGVIIREDLREKFNAPKPTDYASILEYLKIVKENVPGMIPYDRNTADDFFTVYFDTADLFNVDILKKLLVYKLGEFDTIYSVLDLPEYRDYLSLTREIYQNGYSSKSLLSKQTTSEEDFQNGLTAMTVRNPHTAGLLAGKVESLIPGAKVEYYSLDTGNMVNLMGYKAGNAISTTSPNPERALMFLDAAQTDLDIYKLIFYGIEGTHYAMTADGKITLPEGVTSDNVKYPAYINRAFYNSDIHIPNANLWPRYTEIWEDAEKREVGNPLVAYVTNTDAISTELAAVNNLIETYIVPLDAGVLVADEVWDEMVKAFDDAGLKTIMAEVQKQMDAYLAQ